MAAAPAPATAPIRRLRNRATSEQRSFDVHLANNTPLSVGRPPNAPAPLPHNAVPTAGWAGMGACNDRANHNLAPANDCSDAINNQYGAALAAVGGGLPNPVSNGNDPRRCPRGPPAFGHHAAGFTVCMFCAIDTRNQPWSTQIEADVSALPQDLPAPAAVAGRARQNLLAAPIYSSFLTHLCSICERDELILLRDRLNGFIPWHLSLFINRTEGHPFGPYPYVTCTCLEYWARDTDLNTEVGIQHRQVEACDKHDEMLIMRAQNDKWLRETRRHPNNPTVVTRASRQLIRGRGTRGVYRACRCGRELRYHANQDFQVYMCLGCEGVVHNVAPVQAMAGPNQPNATTRRSTRRFLERDDIKLRRRRVGE